MEPSHIAGLPEFLKTIGCAESPLGIFYSDQPPAQGLSPAPMPGLLPTREKEQRGQVDWPQVFESFSCVMGTIWRARRKQAAAYFDVERFGCPGGAFYLGFLGPQTDTIVYYVSTGVPGRLEGERYFDSPEACRCFFETIDPLPAPARYCILKPIEQFGPAEEPDLVAFFCRPETLCGLHQLATFATGDLEAVRSPMGAACSNLIAWPYRYLVQGEQKAVLGGWDPSARKFFKTDEMSLSLPWDMFQRMLERWPQSFLTTKTWATVHKKIARSARAWGEEA
ncbi:MAG: hypothetical protein C4525_15765 [Desulfarculus sp.]|jgi:uncharacterized protein (DUF169 family)|nr:MAG: hypothetical protein C4525_15765 [Desulfarculus sp.]